MNFPKNYFQDRISAPPRSRQLHALLEDAVTHHVIHTPTPPTHTHSGIIVLISKEFEVLTETVEIPGRLVNIHIKHKTTKVTYNLSAFYGPRLAKMTKAEMSKVTEAFTRLHEPQHNNNR